jgi:hypothetical protein
VSNDAPAGRDVTDKLPPWSGLNSEKRTSVPYFTSLRLVVLKREPRGPPIFTVS